MPSVLQPLEGRPAAILGARLDGGPLHVEANRQDGEGASLLELKHDGWTRRFGLVHERSVVRRLCPRRRTARRGSARARRHAQRGHGALLLCRAVSSAPRTFRCCRWRATRKERAVARAVRTRMVAALRRQRRGGRTQRVVWRTAYCAAPRRSPCAGSRVTTRRRGFAGKSCLRAGAKRRRTEASFRRRRSAPRLSLSACGSRFCRAAVAC